MSETIKVNITITPTTDDLSILEIETEHIKTENLSELFDWILHNLRYANKRKIKRVK